MAHRLKTLQPRVKPLVQRAQGWAQTTTDGTTARGYGWAWQQLRERILQRDCGLCQECKRNGKVKLGTEVDHIVQAADGGTDEDHNLELLCHDCHADKTAAEGGKRRKVRIGLDGWPE